MMTMAYRIQTNGQAERINKPILTRLSHYAAKHQKDWYTFFRPLTYAFNTQVYWSTKQTPFGLILSRHQLEPTALESSSALPTVGYAEVYPQVLRSYLEVSIDTLRAKVDPGITTAQQRYKRKYDSRVLVTTTFHPEDWKFTDKPSIAAPSDTDATRTEVSSYNKLMARSLGPFHVKPLCAHSLVNDERGIYNVVSTDCATQAPQTEHLVFTDNSSTRQKGKEDLKVSPRSAQCKLDTAKSGSAKWDNVTPEYTVEKIIRHVGTGENIWYVV